ncbi:MurR/RpiR family transcriptional regulator [Salinicoccus sp. ID82-1]|uniref:MurR/RpiR family transcriptional regulator n=1 Tax=Salinicoccus sp. ID82-1 TaxID=2820269 RepID=UPI001F18E741|nr:MurR/RpiR family transcriptional regulator [Salinicoccus sp. ID82-1]MCG1010723.1 MurR/RpiR family transcriptional regulator [Salinicoccus sp. ID82-1]
MGNDNILNYMIENKHRMSKKHQYLVDYVLENHQDISLMSASELSKQVGVGKTTVLRFIHELGFDSFYSLKKELLKLQKNYSNKWENIQSSYEKDDDGRVVNIVWKEQKRLLDDMMTPHLMENYDAAIDLMVKSRTINLLGMRPYRAATVYMEALVKEFSQDIRQLSQDSESIIDQLLHLGSEDVIIIFEFSPHLAKSVDVAEIAHSRGIPVIFITDNVLSPIIKFSDIILELNSSQRYFTLIPMMALIEIMVVELGQRQSPDAVDNIKLLSTLLKEKGYMVD